MVTIKLWIEGGVLPPLKESPRTADESLRKTIDYKTLDNTNSLRESFKKLFSKVFTDENNVRFIPEMGSGRNQTRNFFKDDFLKYDTLMLIDLDAPKIKIKKTLSKISEELEMPCSEIEGKVFFMVQEMEAWILSQPDVIEEVFARYKIGDILIKEDKILKKNVETITKPSKVLKRIFKCYFVVKKSGENQELQYGKLKNSHDLIEKLDLQKLRNTFEDVERLVLKINEISSKT